MGKNVIISTLPNISQNYLPKVNTSNIFANSLVYDNGTSVMIDTTTTHSSFANARLVVNRTGNSYIEIRAISGQSALALTTGTSSASATPTVEFFNSGNFGIVAYRPGVVSSNYLMYYNLSSSTNRYLAIQTEGQDRITINQNGTIDLTGALSGTSATFSSSLSVGGYLTGTGTNPGGLGGSRYVLDWNNGNTRLFSYGADASTNGGFVFNSQRSDGTNSINFLSFATSGAATFSNDIIVNGGGWIRPNNIYAFTADAGSTYIQQPSGGNIVLRKSDSTILLNIANSGAANFISSVQLSSLVTAPSYGSGSTGLNIGYMNFQNVIGIQACYANNIYYDGANWKSISSSVPWAAAVRLQAGHIDFHTASVSSSGQTMSNWDTTDLKMRITSGGNVGIGSSSPSAWNGNQGLLVSQTGTGNTNTIYSLQSAATSVDTGGILEGFSTNTTSGSKALGSIVFLRENTSTTALSSYTGFYTNNAGTVAERMRITSGGNLLLGTSSEYGSGFKFQVNGSAYITGIVYSNAGFYINSGQYNSITDTPYTGMYMTGSSSTDGFGALLITSRTDTARPIIFGTSNGTNSVERMRITSGGNVLVGTTSDAGNGKLQVSGKTKSTSYISENGSVSIAAGASANIYAMSDNGLYTVQIIVAGGSLIYSAAAIFYAHNSNSQYVKAIDLYDGANVTLDNSGTYIRITNNGFATFTWNWSVIQQAF